MAVFVHSVVIICFKCLFVDRLGPTATLRLMTTRIFLYYFSRDQNSQHFMKTFLQLMPLLSALFYASKQLITQASPIM